MTTTEHPAPLVHDRCIYDAASMERARLQRYTDRLAMTLANADDPDAADDSLVRKLMEGRAIQDAVRHRPIPRHRALVRLSDIAKKGLQSFTA